ncbi:MAG: APC family permease, partial [Candidatus Dormibacteria bacterium]
MSAPDLPTTAVDPDESRYLTRAGRDWGRQLPDSPDNRWRVAPDLEVYEDDEDTGGGTGVIRVSRAERTTLERAEGGGLRSTARAERQLSHGLGGVFGNLRAILLGQPLATAQLSHERLTKVKALAVLSSDALSSVAYATEQTLAVLILAGAGALRLSLPIGAAIVGLLIVVGLSYRQTIRAYPRGGGSYIVAKDNLGAVPGLVAAASLMTDYILTVAVSVSAGVGAVTSAAPSMAPYLVPMGLAVIALIVLVNLRGIREAGSIFSLPTYLFLAAMMALLAGGFIHLFLQGHQAPSFAHSNYNGPLEAQLGLFLILKAFSSGCTALTGVEAISDGVPAFQAPEWKNARTTLMVMVGILAISFSGITYLAHQFALQPDFIRGSGGLPGPFSNAANYHGDYQTILSKLAHVVFGNGVPYYFVQATTALILALAANTSFSD